MFYEFHRRGDPADAVSINANTIRAYEPLSHNYTRLLFDDGGQLDICESYMEVKQALGLEDIINIRFDRLETLMSEGFTSIETAITAIGADLDALIVRLSQTGAGGLTKEEVDQVVADLSNVGSKVNNIDAAVTPPPPPPVSF